MTEDYYHRHNSLSYAFSKAMRTYQLLLNNGLSSDEMETSQINLRFGISAMECEAWEEAQMALKMAQSFNPDSFEVNANLGRLEFLQKNYSRAVPSLKTALKSQPEHEESLRYLGQSLYRLKRYSEAVPYLRQAVTNQPNDKESLYALGRCLYYVDKLDMAQKIFHFLRTDPQWGPSASLYSGTIFAKRRDWENALNDYTIGIRHADISPQILLELKYRMAEAFNQTQKLDRALALLNELYEEAPGYKDVAAQIKRYRELNSNKNLQIYMLSPTNDFIPLCQKIVYAVYPKAQISFNNATVQKDEYVDLLTEVVTDRWEDAVLFRFMRTEGLVGELFVRDMYAHTKELHAGRGFCFTTGFFSPEASRFAEARLIDLMDKAALMKVLKSIDSESLEIPAPA